MRLHAWVIGLLCLALSRAWAGESFQIRVDFEVSRRTKPVSKVVPARTDEWVTVPFGDYSVRLIPARRSDGVLMVQGEILKMQDGKPVLFARPALIGKPDQVLEFTQLDSEGAPILVLKVQLTRPR